MDTNAIRIDVLRMAFVLIRVDSWLKSLNRDQQAFPTLGQDFDMTDTELKYALGEGGAPCITDYRLQFFLFWYVRDLKNSTRNKLLYI